jgi:hypothetical protein
MNRELNKKIASGWRLMILATIAFGLVSAANWKGRFR